MEPLLLSKNQHSLLEAIVESSEDAIYSKTLGGLILSWNHGAEQLYGYSAHEMIGRSVSVLVPEERQPELAAILHQLAQGQRVTPFETVRRRKDGCLIEVLVTISPVWDATGGSGSYEEDGLSFSRQAMPSLNWWKCFPLI